MPFFVPQVQPIPLPTPGSAIERAVMDWKVVADGTDFHKAKDVAAFANHLGGTILVGAKETEPKGHLECYPGLEAADAAAVRETFSRAVRDRCEPPPQIDFEEYDAPSDTTKRVVAVNVWPSLLLIGVRVAGNKSSEGYGGPAYVFPVRSGTDALYLTPSQLAMYMTPQIRRVAVLLSRIPANTTVTIREPMRPGGAHQYQGTFLCINEAENIATFRSETQKTWNIPLDCIISVFENWDGAAMRSLHQILIQYGR